jgi:hypothetical protein
MNFFPNTGLQNSTASAYNSKINKWLNSMPEHKNNLSYIYLHPYFSTVQLRQFLTKNNIDTAQTLNSYIKAILSAAQHNSQLFYNIDNENFNNATNRWKELRQLSWERANGYRFEQKPSPTQASKAGSTLKFEDLVKVREELPDGSIDKLLLSFYTYIPPIRSDFYATQVLDFDKTPTHPNYIFHNTQKSYMKITDFKTAGLYKSIEYELPSELHRQLQLSLTQNPRTFLFQNKNGDSFTRTAFSKWASIKLSQLFKKEFTLTLFRHIFISNLDPKTSSEELLEISKKMGHSITQQMLYRWREEESD